MATVARMYGYALQAAFLGAITWGDTNCKVALLKSTYSPNQDTDEKWEDISSHEVSNGGGYTTDGETLTFVGGSISYENDVTPGGIANLLADDITWSAMTKSGADAPRTAVVYYDGGTGYQQPLIGYILYEANLEPTAQDLSIEWTDGIVGRLGLEGSRP